MGGNNFHVRGTNDHSLPHQDTTESESLSRASRSPATDPLVTRLLLLKYCEVNIAISTGGSRIPRIVPAPTALAQVSSGVQSRVAVPRVLPCPSCEKS